MSDQIFTLGQLIGAAVFFSLLSLGFGYLLGRREAVERLRGRVRLMILELDADDFDAVQTAIGRYCSTCRWCRRNGGGVMLPDGDGNLAGRVVAEICRTWSETHGARQ